MNGSPHGISQPLESNLFDINITGTPAAGSTVTLTLLPKNQGLNFKCEMALDSQHLTISNLSLSLVLSASHTSLTERPRSCLRGFLVITGGGVFTTAPTNGQFITCPVPSNGTVPGRGFPTTASTSSTYAIGHSNSSPKTSISARLPGSLPPLSVQPACWPGCYERSAALPPPALRRRRSCSPPLRRPAWT